MLKLTSNHRRIGRLIFICLIFGSYFCFKTLILISKRQTASFDSLLYYHLSSSDTPLETLTTESSLRSLLVVNSTSAHDRLERRLFNASCISDLRFPDWVQKQCVGNWSSYCQQFSCLDLLRGNNQNAYKLTDRFMNEHPRHFPSDDRMEKEIKNCSSFRNRNGYNEKPVTAVSEDQFPIAFNLIVHKDAHQVERLLRALYRPHHVYCIHVDAAVSSKFRAAMKALAACFDNVYLSSRSEKVSWGGYSRLQADINCMEDHMFRDVQWRYLINTAGQAYPIKTIDEMTRILKIYNGANDIEGIYGHRVLRSRFENEWLEDSKKRTVRKTGKLNPPPPHSIDIVRGSAYGIFSRDFVKFILEDQKAIDLRNWSRSTWSPDEFYWSTLHHTYSNPHLHTPGAFSGYPSKKPWLAVYANWDPGSCHGQSVRSVCVFGIKDLSHVIKHREFFANKFYADFQPLALDCMQAWIAHKDKCPVEFDEKFYTNLPFINRDDT